MKSFKNFRKIWENERIDKVKERDTFEEISSREKIELLQKGIKVNFIEENVAEKNLSKSWEIWREEDASRLMEWGMKQKGGKDATRTRKCPQFTASGCHKQNTFEKEGFEWKYSCEQYEGDEKGRALN